MALPRVLLMHNTDVVRSSLSKALEANGFEVVSATSASEALLEIRLDRDDVLLSDLHRLGTEEDLIVMMAMLHANLHAASLLLRWSPELEASSSAILTQAEETLQHSVKVIHLMKVVQRNRMRRSPRRGAWRALQRSSNEPR